jgi:hypothetical protein
MKRQKGFYFTTDAVLATVLLLTGLLLFARFFVHQPQTDQTDVMSKDLLNTLNEITIEEFDEPFIRQEIGNKNITDLNKTVLLQIGEYWSTNESDKARNLSRLLVERLVPENYGINITLGDDVIYQQNRTTEVSSPRDVLASQRMITGIAKGETLRGSSSAAYLKKIRDKRTASYVYFGGFEGQGNITKYVEDIPTDVTTTDIQEILLELDADHDFTLTVNGNLCALYMPTQPGMIAEIFNATNCKNLMHSGRNTFLFTFEGDINESYIAGGYIKVRYKTDEFHHNTSYGIYRYNFPGIYGIMNVYSSLSVPGTINSYSANVTFFNNYTTYLTIANETIFNVSGSNITQNVYRERSNIQWDSSTIPLRLGVLNLDTRNNQSTGQPSDIVFVSDVSGSMGDCVFWKQPQYWCTYQCRQTSHSPYLNFACAIGDSDDCDNDHRPCGGDHWNRCRNFDEGCNLTKLDLLKVAENWSVDRFLNVTGVQVGLVSFSSTTKNVLALTTDKPTLYSRINGYAPDANTCIACGILSARALYPHLHKEYMIVISDGDANRNTTGGSGRAMAETIEQGQAACAEGITVYTIGFGSDISAAGTNTLIQTACNSSLYYNATNVSQLEIIIRNITETVIVLTNYTSQTMEIVGNVTKTNLSPDSYIEINYTPSFAPVPPNEITIAFESEKFSSCNQTIALPGGVRFLDAKMTSYSGAHWTDGVIVNTEPVFNLSMFSADYSIVGDPFIVQIPTDLLIAGTNNTFNMRTGDNPNNMTNCSRNNSFIYLVGINSSTSRTNVLKWAEGCAWSIEFEDGTFLNTSIPHDYLGFKTCNYTNASIAYNASDAYDLSTYNILHELDFDQDGRVFVNLNAEDLEIVVTLVSQVPYLWGPSYLKVVIWR